MEEETPFEYALLTAAGFCLRCMNQEAVEDILIVAVTPNGAMQFIGTGNVHPTNEEVQVSEGAMLIFRNDLKEAMQTLANAPQETGDESEETGDEQEEGDNA